MPKKHLTKGRKKALENLQRRNREANKSKCKCPCLCSQIVEENVVIIEEDEVEVEENEVEIEENEVELVSVETQTDDSPEDLQSRKRKRTTTYDLNDCMLDDSDETVADDSSENLFQSSDDSYEDECPQKLLLIGENCHFLLLELLVLIIV